MRTKSKTRGTSRRSYSKHVVGVVHSSSFTQVDSENKTKQNKTKQNKTKEETTQVGGKSLLHK